MDPKDYRRELERKVARERSSAEGPRWDAMVESAGGQDRMGDPSGDASDSERLRSVLEDRGADPELRIGALGSLASREAGPEAHVVPLARLRDGDEDPALRAASLQILRSLEFHSPTQAEWRPEFVEALRSASRAPDEMLRRAALAVLSSMKDRQCQEVLLRGLEHPEEALVDPEHALRFLAEDLHSGVVEVARGIADAPPSEGLRLEALRVLAGDPDSAERFRSVLEDSSNEPAARKLAATALGNLAPDVLRRVAAEIESSAEADAETEVPPRAGLSEPSRRARSDDQVRRHISALLDVIE